MGVFNGRCELEGLINRSCVCLLTSAHSGHACGWVSVPSFDICLYQAMSTYAHTTFVRGAQMCELGGFAQLTTCHQLSYCRTYRIVCWSPVNICACFCHYVIATRNVSLCVFCFGFLLLSSCVRLCECVFVCCVGCSTFAKMSCGCCMLGVLLCCYPSMSCVRLCDARQPN